MTSLSNNSVERVENQVNPKNQLKTMKMETENNENRVGIYTQVSAEATAAGEGLAPQGEKSPVAISNGNPNIISKSNQAEDMNVNVNVNANQSQCNSNVSQIQANQSQDNTNDGQSISTRDNPFANEENPEAAGSQSGGDWDGGDERMNRDNKYRIKRIVNMRKEFKKLQFSNSALKAMEDALEAERKRRHNANKMARYCQENNLDENTAKQRMLERKEREIAKYKAEKAAREEVKGQNRGLPDLRDDRTHRSRFDNRSRDRGRDRDRDNNRSQFSIRSNDINSRPNQTGRRYREGPPHITFISPAILAGVPPSLKDKDPGPRYKKPEPLSWRAPPSPNNRLDGERNRSRSPLNRFQRDEEFEEVRRRMGLPGNRDRDTSPSSDSTDQYNTEKSVSAFCNSYNLSKLSKKQRKKARKKARNLLNMEYQIEIQIVNKVDPFGKISEDHQPLLLEALTNIIQNERQNGADWIKVGECVYRRNVLYVRCRNEETVDCLEEKMPFFNLLLPGADLYLAREKVKLSYNKVHVSLKNINLTTEEFFKIIKKQNNYPTELWREYCRRGDTYNLNIMFGVDPTSFERLQKDKGYVFFFLGRLLLRLS